MRSQSTIIHVATVFFFTTVTTHSLQTTSSCWEKCVNEIGLNCEDQKPDCTLSLTIQLSQIPIQLKILPVNHIHLS